MSWVRYDEARDTFQEALARDPTNQVLENGLRRAQNEIKRITEARTAAERFQRDSELLYGPDEANSAAACYRLSEVLNSDPLSARLASAAICSSFDASAIERGELQL